MKSVVYGLIGSVLGALLWALVAYAAEVEFGWIAWGVGGLVGFSVARGNEGRDRSAAAAGTLAVVLTVLSIVAGKYVAVQMLMPSDAEIVADFSEAFDAQESEDFDDHEFVLSFLADEVAAEFATEGREVSWPAEVDPSTALKEADYPADVWAEAQKRWVALGPEGRAAFRDNVVRGLAERDLPGLRAAISMDLFLGVFGPMDLLFFALAMFTAFKVGSGRTKVDDDADPIAIGPPVKEVIREPVTESDLERQPGAAGYCPSCGMQYRAGVQTCADCDAQVLPFYGPPA